jgi:glycyl-tRNA synthetase alpha subunit
MLGDKPHSLLSVSLRDRSLIGRALKDDWNELTVRAQGDRIQIWLNGSPTVDYTELDEKIAKTGVIALQIHSGPPTEAWYRNIRIKSL